MHRKLSALLILALFALLPPTPIAHAATSCISLSYNVMAPGYSGIQIDTTVRVPGDSPNCPKPSAGWPMILSVHGIGGNKNSLASQSDANAQAGYIGVTFSWRGHGSSTGTFRMLHSDEWQDLRSLLTWLLNTYPNTKSVVNPTRVGIEGSSMGGLISWIAATQNMGFRDSVPDDGTPSGEDFFTVNGCANNSLASFFLTTQVNWDTSTQNQLWTDFSNQDDVSPIRNFFLAPDHNFSQNLPQTTAFVFNTVSFLDRFQFPPTSVRGYYDNGQTPKRLYLASNGHQNIQNFADTKNQIEAWRVAWHAHWLQDVNNGVETGGPISYMGYLPGDPATPANHTVSTDTSSWPPPGVVSTPLYLRSGGKLSLSAPATTENSDRIVNTLLDSSYTLHQAVYNENPPFSQTSTKISTSSVSYLSSPLAQPVWWLGEPQVTLYTSADAPNYNIHALFYDVTLDAQGRITSSYLISQAQSCWHSGDSPNRTYSGLDMARRIDAGHAIQVVMQNLDPETSSTNALGQRMRPVLANYTANVFHQPGQASSLSLPLKPDNPGQPVFQGTGSTPTPTSTLNPTATPTQQPPTATPTNTATQQPPTATPTSTATQPPPTATPTQQPPTATPTSTATQPPPTSTPTRTATLPPPTQTPAPTQTPPSGGNVLVNPGFESGPGLAWTESNSVNGELISKAFPHTGAYGVQFCSANNCTSYVEQTVTLPSNAALSYWWYMDSKDNGVTPKDILRVELYTTTGILLAPLRLWDNTAASGVWAQDHISLSLYGGQTVRLRFTSLNDVNFKTTFYIDDASIQ